MCSKGKKTFKVRPQLDAITQTKDSKLKREYRPEEMPLPAAETALKFPEITWRSSLRFLFGRKGYDPCGT